jgi:hypothetical protein
MMSTECIFNFLPRIDVIMSDLQSSQPLSIYPTAARWSLQQSLDHYQQRFIDFYDSYETIWRMDPFEAIWRTDPFEAIWRMDFILRDVDPDRSLKALALLLDVSGSTCLVPVLLNKFFFVRSWMTICTFQFIIITLIHLVSGLFLICSHSAVFLTPLLVSCAPISHFEIWLPPDTTLPS